MSTKLKQFDYTKYGKLALFAKLNSALENSNFKKAAEAQSDLKKLGVIVKFKELAAQSEKECNRCVPENSYQKQKPPGAGADV